MVAGHISLWEFFSNLAQMKNDMGFDGQTAFESFLFIIFRSANDHLMIHKIEGVNLAQIINLSKLESLKIAQLINFQIRY